MDWMPEGIRSLKLPRLAHKLKENDRNAFSQSPLEPFASIRRRSYPFVVVVLVQLIPISWSIIIWAYTPRSVCAPDAPALHNLFSYCCCLGKRDPGASPIPTYRSTSEWSSGGWRLEGLQICHRLFAWLVWWLFEFICIKWRKDIVHSRRTLSAECAGNYHM